VCLVGEHIYMLLVDLCAQKPLASVVAAVGDVCAQLGLQAGAVVGSMPLNWLPVNQAGNRTPEHSSGRSRCLAFAVWHEAIFLLLWLA
jgi:hypothetical protein